MGRGGDPYKQQLRGQALDIQALAWNRLMEQARQRDVLSASGDVANLPRDLVRLKVRNDSGGAVDLFGILGLHSGSGPLLRPADNFAEFGRQPGLSGATPASGDSGLFCVLLEPLAAGAIGWAAVAGVVPVQVTGTAASQVDVTAGDSTQLTMGAGGTAQVLWADAGNGTRWALVHLAGAAGSSMVPDCSATVDGTVNLTTQYLGAGTKTLDAVAVARTPGTSSTASDYKLSNFADGNLPGASGAGHAFEFTVNNVTAPLVQLSLTMPVQAGAWATPGSSPTAVFLGPLSAVDGLYCYVQSDSPSYPAIGGNPWGTGVVGGWQLTQGILVGPTSKNLNPGDFDFVCTGHVFASKGFAVGATTGSGGTQQTSVTSGGSYTDPLGNTITGGIVSSSAPANQTANTGLLGPASGSAAAPTFRAITMADLPGALRTAVYYSGY